VPQTLCYYYDERNNSESGGSRFGTLFLAIKPIVKGLLYEKLFFDLGLST